MTTEQTITIHHEPPPETIGRDKIIFAYSDYCHKYFQTLADDARRGWGRTYTAWYDPQVGEPVKARRYVVVKQLHAPAVLDGPCNAHYYIRDKHSAHINLTLIVADRIPTREAAQAIADIYERAAEGGEA